MKKTDKELVEMIAQSLHDKGEHKKALGVVELYKTSMNKTEKQKLIVKTFIKTVNEKYNVVQDFDDDEGGRMTFSIMVDGNEEHFQYHRRYFDVCTWKVKGDDGYEKSMKLEDELNELSEHVQVQIDDEVGI